jgi:protein gp37
MGAVMTKTNIEWTEESWNPIVGCSILTPGCTNCYAMKMAARIEAMNLQARETERSHGTKKTIATQYDGTTKTVNGNAVWTGKLAPAGDNILLAPLKRKKPTTYFVNSMGDLFHDDVPDAWIDRVFAVMALSPQHTFQVLTKRAARMRDYFARVAPEPYTLDPKGFEGVTDAEWHAAIERGWPLDNLWLGVSAERQQEADERIPHLLQTPAAVRFISAEPLLGPIDLTNVRIDNEEELSKVNALTGDEGRTLRRIGGPQLDWVIAGGESGHDARPMHPAWPRALRDQCAAAGVPFFFKQWGEWHPRRDDDDRQGIAEHCLAINGAISRGDELIGGGVRPRWIAMDRLGKGRAGRLLDGVTHDAMPGRAP